MNKYFLTALIFCGFTLNALMGVDINGDFKQVKGNLPVGWIQNFEEWAKPYGTVSIIKSGDNNFVSVKSLNKATQVYMTNSIPGANEDEFVITVKVRGEGTGFLGIMSYDANDRWLASEMSPIKFEAETGVFRKTFELCSHNGKNTAKIRVAFGAGANSNAVFEQIKIELQEEEEE